jgi:hypothetical protein
MQYLILTGNGSPILKMWCVDGSFFGVQQVGDSPFVNSTKPPKLNMPSSIESELEVVDNIQRLSVGTRQYAGNTNTIVYQDNQY